MNDCLKYEEFIKIINSNSLSEKSVADISKDYNISIRYAYLLKFRIVEFTPSQLSFIDIFSIRNVEILGIISLMEAENRELLLGEFNNICLNINPFDEIDNLLNKHKSPNVLEQLSDKYWICIYEYLIERSINQYPFNLTSINFIKSISRIKYINLSEKQKSWILNLLKADLNGFDPNPIFSNSILLEKGLSHDFELINDYFNNLK